MKQARILVVTPGRVPGCDAESLHVSQVALALSRFYELDVLCPMLGRQGHVLSFHGARLLRVPVTPDGSAAEAFRRAVGRQLADGLYDVVHVRTPLEGKVALEQRERAGFTLLYEPGGVPGLARPMTRESGRMAAERELAREADVCVVPTSASAGCVARLRPASRPRIVAPGVDTDVFDRMDLRLHEPPVTLLLDETASDPRLGPCAVRVPSDPWGPELFRPETARDLALCLNAAGACVAPPCAEGLPGEHGVPGLLHEAAACARPLAAPDSPGVREALGPAVEPFLYAPAAPEGPAEALRRASRPDAGDARIALARHVRELRPATAYRRALLGLYAGLVAPRCDFPAAPDAGPGHASLV
jgi:glycosyltransferase involved in cell wall biosynthesis